MIAALNLFWRVVPGRLELAGIAVGLVGVLMLTQGAGFQASPAGLAAIATACITWSVGSVLSQRSLPLAEHHMLESRERQKAICLTAIIAHGESSETCTPAGGVPIVTL